MTKIFVALPNMLELNQYILAKLSHWSKNPEHQIYVSELPEARFHDFARNTLVKEFLQTDCEYLLFLDADIDPHPGLIRLAEYGKDIISGNVMSWQKGELMPSIWKRAACEECKVVRQWQQIGTIPDERNYLIEEDALYRWNPLTQRYELFHDRETRSFAQGKKCRCQDTGKDPFVYHVHPEINREQTPIKVDAVGGASMCIKRQVLEKMPSPWFQFLFRPDREIMVTEDLFFCYKAQLSGYEVWADHRMVCGHYKKVNLLAMNQWAGGIFEMGRKEGARNNGRIITPDWQ
jgi:hypothetical protein